ncbi:MAG TPA: WD40 repeat domain-containing serine/threonine protein kinase, partial [Verrucomicrobiae bacterium]|nr:WD40 repeat domain-containing serine/threonine protein kinase [Verrucomicrobiae bacterium]
IVAIHDVGQHDDHHYFSMDFVEGKSLGDLVREHPLAPKEAARCVKAVAEAIQFAHTRGVLHRDLKPSNIMLGTDGAPRVTDFGLAKMLVEDSELTLTGAVLGSPGYMPPEQAQGHAEQIGVRSDVYALGGILYEALTGHPPFRAATPLETLKLVSEQEPVPPRTLNPRLPRDLDTICLKCLEKSPGRRYATAQELADELGRYLADQPIRARPTGPAEKLWRWCRRQPGLAVSLGFSLVLLSALTAVSLTTAARLQRQSAQTIAAKREAEEKLWASYLSQARAGRLSALAGRRGESLAAVTAAARWKPSLELRNEAIACLALSDIGDTHAWRGYSNGQARGLVVWDRDLARCALQRQLGILTVMRASDYAVLGEFRLSRTSIRFGQFSPDGNYLAANASDGRAQVWSLNPQVPFVKPSLPPVPNHPNLLAFHPHQGCLAVAGQDQKLHFFNLTNGLEMAAVPLESAPVGIAFAPSGDTLAVAAAQEITRWSWPALERLKGFKHGARLTCIAWHPDGRRLAAGDANGGLLGWDTKLDVYITLPAHGGQTVSQLAFHPQGDIMVSHGWDGLSRFWDTASARQLFATATGLATKFDRAGHRLAFHREPSGFGTWDFIRSESFQLHSTTLQPSGVDFSPNGRWLAYTDSTGWYLVDLATGQELAFVSLPTARSPVFHPDGQSLVVLTLDAVLRWTIRATNDRAAPEIGSGATLLSLPGHDLQRVSISQDGTRLAFAGQRGSFVLDWDHPASPITLARGRPQSHVAISPDSRWIVTTTHNGMGAALWNIEGQFNRLLLTNENSIAAFSTDGRTLVTTSSRDYCLWDTSTWQVRRRVPLDLGSAVAGVIAFSPDGRLLAVAANRREIKLLHPQTGDELATLTAPDPQNLARLVFSPDSARLVATTVGRSIQIWKLSILRRQLAELGLDW